MAKKKKDDRLQIAEGSSLKDITKALNNKFGAEAVRIMSDTPSGDIPTISTGSLQLDHALGIGGFPRGRIVEIMGPEASGKCLSKDTYFVSRGGLFTLEEIFESKGVPPTCATATIPCKVDLLNRSNLFESTAAFTKNNRRKIRRIKTKSGLVLDCTYKHPILTISKLGNWVWKYAHELTTEDYVCVLRAENRDVGTISISPEEAYLLGIFIADGHLGTHRISVTNDDPDIISFLRTQAPNIIGTRAKEYIANKSIDFKFGGLSIVESFYNKFGLTACNSPEKELSKIIRSFDYATMREFIRGYMDCECYISGKKLEVTSASYMLLYQLKLILQQIFGIIGSLNKKLVHDYPENEYWRLCISGSDFSAYMDRIGTNSMRRRTQVDMSGTTDQAFGGSIPYLGPLLNDIYMSSETTRVQDKLTFDYRGDDPKCLLPYRVLRKIITDEILGNNPLTSRLVDIRNTGYFYDKVVSNSDDLPTIPTFDFSMPETNSFVSNGIITHNTTIALHAMASVTREGGAGLFVDAENALDLSLVEKVGVNLDQMVINQPTCAEEALDIVEAGVRSKSFDVIVIDSVSALTPRAEIEGEMGDSHMGLQARLMGQAMRKLTRAVSETNTLVIFINQIRMKIGVMFGSPETTSGGQALKFFSSVRLDIRAIKKIKVKGRIIGNRVKVTTIKNKLAPPFKKIETDLIFGRGFVKELELLDMAYELEIIERKGSQYNYDGATIGKGRNKAAKAMMKDPVLFETILADVRAHTTELGVDDAEDSEEV